MTTFSLHWNRHGVAADPSSIARLAAGLGRLRDDPVQSWRRGPLTIVHFADDPWFTASDHPLGFVAVVLGRLDDVADIVARLGSIDSLTPSDSDLLAAAYARWGRRCLEHLIGDFVAVIWHPREGSLLCARDRVGIATANYWIDRDEVVLASNLAGVVAHAKVDPAVNEGYVAEILTSDFITSRKETLYRDVRRLLPGDAMLVDDRAERTWHWAPPYNLTVVEYRDSDEADEAYRDVLTRAIEDRMRGPVLVGAELSGGLDSSTVTALAAPAALERYGSPLRTYSLVFPGLECDESVYIRDVAGWCGVTSTLSVAPPRRRDLEAEARRTKDLPLPPNAPPWVELRRRARADGVGAILTGAGGDHWFVPSGRYPLELAAHGRIRASLDAAHRLHPDAVRLNALMREVVRPLAATMIRTVWPGFRSPDPPAWIADELIADCGLQSRMRPPSPTWTARAAREQVTRSGWEAYWQESSSLTDAISGVPSTHPFHDARVIQFALGLDEVHRWSDWQFRTIQRRATAECLPESVRDRRTKAEFGHLMVECLEGAGGAARFASLTIARSPLWISELQATGTYKRMLDAYESEGPTAAVWPLWLCLAVDTWFRR